MEHFISYAFISQQLNSLEFCSLSKATFGRPYMLANCFLNQTTHFYSFNIIPPIIISTPFFKPHVNYVSDLFTEIYVSSPSNVLLFLLQGGNKNLISIWNRYSSNYSLIAFIKLA